MSSALRKLSGIIYKTKTSVIFLNQTRIRLVSCFWQSGNNFRRTGLKFYSSVRLDLRRIAQIKSGDEIIGNRVKAKIVKNKVAAPFKVAEFDIYYNEGISYEGDLLNLALKEGLVKKSGSWYQYGKEKMGQGSEGAKKFLKENPSIAEEIREKVTQQEDST